MAIDPRLLALCEKITAKRPRTVIDLIKEHGQITTDEPLGLGYTHAPRAVRNVREQGVPLETIRVKSAPTGRCMAACVFDDPFKIEAGRIGGRKGL